MRVVAVATIHRAFKDLMTEGLTELGFGFRMTGHAELRLVGPEHRPCSLSGFLSRRVPDIADRTGLEFSELRPMSAMAFRTADIAPPVIAPAEIVMGFLSGVTREAGLGGSFRIQAFEGDYLGFVSAALDVRLAGTVAGFTADHFAFP